MTIAMPVRPVDDWQPLPQLRTRERVVAEVERRILAGKLRAGDHLPPERHLAEALGVSRGAVREAMRILEAVGVTEASTGSGPNSGSVIVADSVRGMATVLRLHWALDAFQVDEIRDLLSVCGARAARRAAECARDEDIVRLRERAALIRPAGDALEAICEFVGAISDASGESLSGTLATALGEVVTASGPQDSFAHSHSHDYRRLMGSVVDAVERRQGTAAAEAMSDLVDACCPVEPVALLSQAG